MCECVDGVVKVQYFKSKASGKQPLSVPNGELSMKISSSGISSANACRQIRNCWMKTGLVMNETPGLRVLTRF